MKIETIDNLRTLAALPGWFSVRQAREKIGFSYHRVRDILLFGVGIGLFERTENARYRLREGVNVARVLSFAAHLPHGDGARYIRAGSEGKHGTTSTT